MKYIDQLYSKVFTSQRKKEVESIIFYTAAFSFVLHFLIVILIRSGILPLYIYDKGPYIVPGPISTIYTPFTIILMYEVYCLIYYLPQSLMDYLGKQYEIITLIFIRNIFDKLSKFPLSMEEVSWERVKELLFAFAGFLILLLLIFVYYKLSRMSGPEPLICEDNRKVRNYITIKKVLALVLFGLFLFLLIRNIYQISYFPSLSFFNIMSVFKSLNNSFFDIFFTALILIEVFLLLLMYNITDDFDKVFRNSGFIISTILLKLSFRATGMINMTIILIAVAFGVAVLGMYKLFKKKL